MLRDQLRPGGIRDERVLAAMAAVRRERFLPAQLAPEAYQDRALPIGHGQTISQPLVVAAMTEALGVGPDSAVLEVGTGSGYQAAVLAQLGARVVTVERDPALAERAQASLAAAGFPGVKVVLGDGSLGWPPGAPYDGILVAAAAPAVPPALVEQLAPGGRLVIPVDLAEDDVQELRVIERREEGTVGSVLFPVRFVPLLPGIAGR